MTGLFSKSIRVQLFLIVLVLALPIAGIMIYSGFELRKVGLADARSDTRKLVDRIVTQQESLETGAEQLMTALAQLPEVRHKQTAKVEPVLKELAKLNAMYTNISIADRTGAVWASAVPMKPAYIGDRRYFKNALARGKLSSGEYVVSRTTFAPAFNLAYPYKDDRGRVAGVITVGFAIDKYRQLLEHMPFPARTSFVLIDHRGIVFTRGLDPNPFVGKEYTPDAFRQMREGPETGTSIRKGLAGDVRIISYRKITLKGEQTPYMYITAGVPVEVALEEAHKNFSLNVTVFTAFLLGAFFLAWLIGKRSIVDRVVLLEEASRKLASGNPEITVSDLVTGGELGRLAQTFDGMAQQLAARASELKAANRELEAFNYTVAHDLRKPLAVIDGYTQIVMEMCGDKLGEKCNSYLKEAHEGTLRMSRLIDALLRFSSLTHAKPTRKPVNLCELCENAAFELKEAEPERRVTFRIPKEIVAEADPDLLPVVLGNLFGNAWKYTSPREEAVIEFGTVATDGEPAYYVRDNGIGFDPAQADRLFVPFQRLESGTEIGGLGIGLATVKRIIKRHGGKVWAEGEPGKGATFYFTLGRS